MKVYYRPIENWPGPITTDRRGSQFKVDREVAIRHLCRELAMIGAESVVIEIDQPSWAIKQDGELSSKARGRADGPRIIASATTNKGPMRMPCDTFTEARHNIRAIGLTLGALRAIDRYGAAVKGEQYQGWGAIPASTSITTRVEAAWAILHREAGRDEDTMQPRNRFLLDILYSRAVRNAHPDVGGTDDRMSAVNRARETIQIDLGQ